MTGLLQSDNVEDRRKRRVPPELSAGPFNTGQPVRNVFEDNGGLLTGLGREDFMPIQNTPLAHAAGAQDLDAIMGALAAQDRYRGE